MRIILDSRVAGYSIAVFALACILRGIPELLIGRYPAGFDATATYPFMIASFPSEPFLEKIGQYHLFSGIMWALQSATNADIYTLLKITGPVLYGTLAASFLFFLIQFIGFSSFKSFIGTLLFVLQPISLRISWDLFRNEFGLVLMFLTLAIIGTSWRHKYLLASWMATVTVFAHPIPVLLLLTMVLVRSVSTGLTKNGLRLALTVFPAFIIFVLTAWAFFQPVSGSRVLFLVPNSNIPSVSVLQNVYRDDFRYIGASYWMIPEFVALLFLVSFAQILPFVVKGIWGEPTMILTTALLGMATVSVVVSPSASIPWYWRWEMLLIIPLTVFAVQGLDRTGVLLPRNRRMLIAFVLVSLVVATGYSSGTFSYMGVFGVSSFAPATMVQASLPPSHIDDTISSLAWLNNNSPPKSYLLSDERFLSFSYLVLRKDIVITVQPGGYPFRDAVQGILPYHPSTVYLVWDSQIAVPEFSTVHSGQYVWVYRYNGVLS